MKNLKYIFAAAAIAAAAAGCSKENAVQTGNFPSDGVVRIRPTVTQTVTKAGSQEYEGTLGLFIDYGTNDKYTMGNVRWSSDANGVWTPDVTMLWKDVTSPASVYAYAPYSVSALYSSQVPFSITPDQSEGIGEADLLYFSQESFCPYSDLDWANAVSIKFKHALVKIELSITYGNQFGDNTPTIKKVVLKKSAGDVICDLSDGEVTAMGTTTDVIMHKHSESGYECICYPADILETGDDFIVVTADDGTGEKNFTYRIPDGGFNLMGGRSYHMNLRVGKNKLVPASVVTVNDWNATEEIEGGEAESL